MTEVFIVSWPAKGYPQYRVFASETSAEAFKDQLNQAAQLLNVNPPGASVDKVEVYP